MLRSSKILVVITMLALSISMLTGCSTKMSVKEVEKTLTQYMQDVYAPKSMEQFKRAKEDSVKLFTKDVTARFFVSYADELTEADLRRVCETYISHGAAENQSDGKERYLVKAYLYNTKGATPIIKDFTFIMNENGKVEDFTITDPE